MKKISVLMVAALLVSGYARAQLILTKAAYEFVAGDVVTSQQCDTTLALPRNTGQYQTWDFSSITQSTNAINTLSYVVPAVAPSASLFPGATLVADNGYNYYLFYKSVASPTAQFEYLGYDDMSSLCHYANSKVESVWPIAFGYLHSDSFSGSLSGASTGSTMGSTSVSAGGTGTLILTGMQFNNVLQLKTTDVKIQNIAAPAPAFSFTNVTTTYEYYVPYQRAPIITVTDLASTDSSGTFYFSSVRSSTTSTLNQLTGIRTQSPDQLLAVFPNPVKNELTVLLNNSSNERCSIELCNVFGQAVKQADPGNDATIKISINVSELRPGVYFLKTRAGEMAVVRKVIVE